MGPCRTWLQFLLCACIQLYSSAYSNISISNKHVCARLLQQLCESVADNHIVCLTEGRH